MLQGPSSGRLPLRVKTTRNPGMGSGAFFHRMVSIRVRMVSIRVRMVSIRVEPFMELHCTKWYLVVRSVHFSALFSFDFSSSGVELLA